MSIVQNDTSPIDFFMADSSDTTGETGKPGLTAGGITFKIAKAGGNFAAGTGTIAAKTGANIGWWQYTPVAGDVGTLGEIAFEATATGCFSWRDKDRVVQAGAAASDWTPTRAAKVDAIDSNATAIKTKTDNLPSDPADESLIIAATDAIQAAIAALNNLSAAGVRAAVGLAAANLDTQLAALPTAAENAAELILEAATTPIAADIQKVNGVTIVGDGSSTPWGA